MQIRNWGAPVGLFLRSGQRRPAYQSVGVAKDTPLDTCTCNQNPAGIEEGTVLWQIHWDGLLAWLETVALHRGLQTS